MKNIPAFDGSRLRSGWCAAALAICAALLISSAAGAAEDGELDTDVHAQRIVIAPYAWAMGMNGTVGINGVAVPLDLQSTELLRGVKSGGMGYLQVPVGPGFAYLDSLSINFGQSNFTQFFNQSIDASLFFIEGGYGWNLSLDHGFFDEGQTLLSPYLGFRSVDMKVKINGPLLMQRIKKNWQDPALGVIVQGPVWHKFNYVLKVDAAGFNIDGDDYRSAMALLRYTFDPAWSVAAGYRASRFKAKPDSANDISIDLTGSGPLLGIQYSF